MPDLLRFPQVTVLRRRPGSLAVPSFVAGLGILMLALGWAGSPSLLLYGLVAWFGGLVLLGLSLFWEALRERSLATVTTDGVDIFADGVPVLPRSELRSAYVQPDPKGPLVRLIGKGARTVDLRMFGPADAHALLRAVHLDANEARVTFLAPSVVLVQPLWQVLFVFGWVALQNWLGLGPRAYGGHPVMIVPFVLLYATSILLPRRIVTGPDGFRVGWLGRGRFFPYARVLDVTHDEDGVRVVEQTGDGVSIRYRGPWWARRNDFFSGLFSGQRLALADRLRAGVEACAKRDAQGDLGALLARGDRTASEWLDALRALGQGATGGYRSASVPRDALWSVAENPSAAPGVRVAAAVALRAKLDGAERARLEALADATVAPKLRVALSAVAAEGGVGDADEASLTEVLREVEPGAARTRVSG